MTKATKYVAIYNGSVIGTRTSHRTYTHAIITQGIEDVCRREAYEYKATKTDRLNFDYYVSIVAAEGVTIPRDNLPADIYVSTPNGEWGGERLDAWRTGEQYISAYSKADISDAKEKVAGGFDAYAERLRQEHIKSFENRKATGGFNPGVAAWAGRLDLAQKAVASHTGPHTKLVAIVPAEPADKAVLKLYEGPAQKAPRYISSVINCETPEAAKETAAKYPGSVISRNGLTVNVLQDTPVQHGQAAFIGDRKRD